MATTITGCSLLNWDYSVVSGLPGGGGAGVSTAGNTSPSSSASSSSSTSSVTSTSSISASSSSGSLSSSSSSSSSSGGVPEDCTNGVDDDLDGHVDCADPDCGAQGFACVGVPSGWSGPAALYDGSPAGLPGCGAPYETTELTANAGLQFGPAICSACGCSPLGASCDFYNHWFAFGDQVCSSGPPSSWSFGPLSGAACGPASAPGVKAYRAQPSAPKIDTPCMPSGGQASLPAPTWSRASLVCGEPTVGAGCAPTAVCAPPPPPGFSGSVCIWRAGDLACPAPFLEKHALHDAGASLTDTRSCTACACTPPLSLSCSMTVSFYADTNCTTLIASVPDDNGCVPSSGDANSAKITGYTPPVGACTATGGTPTGTILASAASTVCCLP